MQQRHLVEHRRVDGRLRPCPRQRRLLLRREPRRPAALPLRHRKHRGDEGGGRLDGVERIRHIPTFIVQGRYDVVCPMHSAFELHRAFPEAQFVVCGQSGHSAAEEETASELVMACDRFCGKPSA